jgi:PAS domain S-box-containing protein
MSQKTKKIYKESDMMLLNRISELEMQIEVLQLQTQEKDSLIKKAAHLQHDLEKTISALLQSEQKYENLYETSPLLFRTVDLKGIIANCNKSYAEHLGYSKDEVIGKSIFDMTAEKSIKQMHESLEAWGQLGHVEEREIWLKRKDGTIFPTLLSATRLLDENGELVGSNTAIKDMTEIYESQRKLEENEKLIQKQLEELKKTEQAKDEFMTMISHELKTPLVPIRGYVDLLISQKMGSLNDKQKEKLNIVKTSSQKLQKLISDLLDAQKIELGKLGINLQQTDLQDVILESVEQMKAVANNKGITMTLQIEDKPSALCDKGRLVQVLTNLISNSIDFVPRNTGRIAVILCTENNHARIIVKDNGVGILKEKVSKLFAKFYQADTTLMREHGGTGLGLAICKGIIESHNGKIWAHSDGPGKGTEVHIELPLNEHA